MTFFEAYVAYKQYYIENIAWIVKDPLVKGKTHEETFEKHVNSMKTSEFIEILMGFSKSDDNPIKEPKTVVDPPSGWMYGFPALLCEDYDKQLRDAGYKEEELEMAKKYSRYWSYTG